MRVSAYSPVSFVLVALFLPAPAVAQDNVTTEVVTVAATGSVSVRPDIAEIMFTIQITAGTADSAASRASDAARAVIEALSRHSSAAPVLLTDGFSVQAGRADQRTGAPFEHVSKHDFRVVVRDIESIPEVIGEAVAVPGIQVRGVGFSASDVEAARDQALDIAVANARQRAMRIASLAGLELGRVVNLVVHPDREDPRRAYQSVGTSGPPVSPQDIVMTAYVSVQYEVRVR